MLIQAFYGFINIDGNKYIAGEEYYIDTDPGAGNGTPLMAADGSYNSSSEVGAIDIDTSGLSIGLHVLYVRTKNSEGQWGSSRKYMFEVIDASTIAAAEYYLDTDPGNRLTNPS